jgi:hypothetical protein
MESIDYSMCSVSIATIAFFESRMCVQNDEIGIEYHVGGVMMRRYVNVHVRFVDLSGDSSGYIVQSWTAVACLVPYLHSSPCMKV